MNPVLLVWAEARIGPTCGTGCFAVGTMGMGKTLHDFQKEVAFSRIRQTVLTSDYKLGTARRFCCCARHATLLIKVAY